MIDSEVPCDALAVSVASTTCTRMEGVAVEAVAGVLEVTAGRTIKAVVVGGVEDDCETTLGFCTYTDN